MAANGRISKLAAGRSGQAFGGRRGSLLVAAVSACLAAVLIYMFVSRQHSNPAPVAAAPTQSTVFVATHYIPAGTPFSQVAEQGLMERKTVPSTQAVAGAIYDPSEVRSQTTTQAIAAGQQVTATEFSPTAKVRIPSYLRGDYRGVAFSLNSYQGLTAGLINGDRVDVMLVKSKAASSELLVSNVEVLSNSGGNVILRLTDKQALIVTAATTVGSIWLDYRPVHGVKQEIKVGDQEVLH